LQVWDLDPCVVQDHVMIAYKVEKAAHLTPASPGQPERWLLAVRFDQVKNANIKRS
jgi:hypothetical protein